jgi:hypothetical protein
VDLDTATRQGGQPPHRQSLILPEAMTTVAAQVGGLSAHSTELLQGAEARKEVPGLLPASSAQSAEPNEGTIVRDAMGRERRRTASTQAGKRPRTDVRFWPLNKWQGQVLSVAHDTFKAQLRDSAHPGTVEHAEFFISDLSEDGRGLLRPGALFYWIIGYRDEGSRQRKRESIVWMRRGGLMGSEKFNAALESVEQLWEAAGDGDQSTTGP